MSLLLALTATGGVYSLTASAGSYSITGVAATVAKGRVLSASSGAYAVSGVAATIAKSTVVNYAIAANAGAYVVSGADASISRSGGSAPSYTNEIEIRKWYVRRGKRLHIFQSGEDADAFIEAEEAAQKAVEQAQRTSRRARKRLRERVFTADALPQQTVEIDALSGLVERYGINADIPALLARQDYERFMQVVALAIEMQEEEDIEMLMLM